MRWTVVLYAEPDDELDVSRISVPTATKVVIATGVAVTLVFGVWPGPLVALAQHAALYFVP